MFKTSQLFVRYNGGLIMVTGLFAIMQFVSIWNGGDYHIFNSPDATVNYHFATQVADGQLARFPAIDSAVSQYVTPRSARVINGYIVPVSFVGLINIYGFFGALFSDAVIPYLTVLFAVLGMIYFYLIVQKIFSRRIAWWSLLLLAVHPAWFYYTQRSLLPNVLFCSLVVATMYYAQAISQHKRKFDFFMTGVFLAAALLVRTSEIVWIAALLVLFWSGNYQKIFSKKIVWTILGASPFILLFIFSSWTLYQAEPRSGYILPSGGSEASGFNVLSYIFPFGVHPRLMWSVGFKYLFQLFIPFSVLGIAGLLSMLRSREKRHRYYIYGWLVGSLYLLTVYGSWFITDSPDPTLVTLGTSYVRYFLPVYIFALPFGAFIILELGDRLAPVWRQYFLGFILITISLVSLQQLVTGAEGLVSQRSALQSYEVARREIERMVPAEAVILTEKGDKYIWPARYVVTPSGDTGYLTAVRTLLEEDRDVYFMHIHMSEVGETAMNESWTRYDFKLGDKLFDESNLSLYRLELAS